MILVSTNGLTINQHFCSGELVEAALFFKAQKCNHETKPMTCCEKKAAAKKMVTCDLNKKKKCCDEKVVIVKVDDEAQPLFVDFQKILPVFIAIISTQNYLKFQNTLEFPTPHYFNYKPPLIVEDDIEVLCGAFLC